MLTPEQWERVRELFNRCVDSEPDAIEEILAREEDAETVAGVRELLETSPATRFLESPLGAEMLTELSDYELGDEIGRGGMGVVHAATHRATGREVAVKLLPVPADLAPVLAAQLRREAARAFSLRHPNIVRIDSVGEEASGPFIVMERIRGASLQKAIGDMRLARGRGDSFEDLEALGMPKLPYATRVAYLLARIADALEYSHINGVVHQDIKPSNILLDEAGNPLLTDYGIARDLGLAAHSATSGGTPHYMSPEQARRESARIDHRTDVYSLAVVGYELLTLERPFLGKNDSEVLESIQRAHPVAIRKISPSVPAPLQSIIEKAMQRELGLRYGSAADMAEDLRRFMGGRPPRAKPPSPLARANSLRQRHPRVTAGVGLALLTLSTVAGAVEWVAHAAMPKVEVPTHAETEVLVTAERLARPGLSSVGDVIDLGSAPVSTRLPDGWYKFVLRDARGTYGEEIRYLARDTELQLDRVRRTSQTESAIDMVRVPGGTYRTAGDHEIYVPTFLLDEYEVTNDEYRTFLDQVEDPAERAGLRPYTWPDAIEDAWTETIGGLPVTGISFYDAAAYARWNGKRLPTRYEWEWAARGEEGRTYVWGDESGDGERCNAPLATTRDMYKEHGEDATPFEWQQYLDLCRAPGSFAEDVSWCGVFDLQANVSEWTVSPSGVEVLGSSKARIIKGGWFRGSIGMLTLVADSVPPIAIGEDHGTGMRCAKSLP